MKEKQIENAKAMASTIDNMWFTHDVSEEMN